MTFLIPTFVAVPDSSFALALEHAPIYIVASSPGIWARGKRWSQHPHHWQTRLSYFPEDTSAVAYLELHLFPWDSFPPQRSRSESTRVTPYQFGHRPTMEKGGKMESGETPQGCHIFSWPTAHMHTYLVLVNSSKKVLIWFIPMVI